MPKEKAKSRKVESTSVLISDKRLRIAEEKENEKEKQEELKK